VNGPFNYWIVFEDEPAPRAMYRTYYEQIRTRCRPAQTLEIGGGSGNLMNFMPAVVSTDIVPAPWLEALIADDVAANGSGCGPISLGAALLKREIHP
jgi:hypothetical protein